MKTEGWQYPGDRVIALDRFNGDRCLMIHRIWSNPGKAKKTDSWDLQETELLAVTDLMLM